MVNSKQSKPSQAAIGRALGLSPASMTKCKKLGMPVHSVEAARAWREHHIAPTMHKWQRKSPIPLDPPQHQEQPSAELRHALALMGVAAETLEAGNPIEAMVPSLRAALHAVPQHERDTNMHASSDVLDVLTADVAAALAELQKAEERPSIEQPMSEDDLDELGQFWYQVAAGEIRVSEVHASAPLEIVTQP